MHVIFRESHGLEESATPTDLGQSPAELVVLSFSDSDLGAFAAAWHDARGGGGGGGDGASGGGGLPSLRLANLAALKHPLSVDTYIERTLEGAKGILIRLIGGTSYWSYGLAQVQALAQRRGIALAVLPADGREDAQLDAVSNMPVSTLRRLAQLCDIGGAAAAQGALAQLALAAGLPAGPVPGARALPECGLWTPESGVLALAEARGAAPRAPRSTAGKLKGSRVLLVFYRAYLVAADMAPVEALFTAFRAEGAEVVGLFAPSLKAQGLAGGTAADRGGDMAGGLVGDMAGDLAAAVRALAPDAIVNLTAFSGRGAAGGSVLDVAGVPVFQAALATSTRAAWETAERGLSPADLAMHVVLPEVDGRLSGGVISFKEAAPRDPALEFSRMLHRPHPGRIAALVARVAGWLRLAGLAAAERRVALVLSTYPGKDWQMGHAVGLDAPASACAILSDLRAAGYDVPERAGGPFGDQAGDLTVGLSGNQCENLTRNLSENLARDLASDELGKIAGELHGGTPGDPPSSSPGDLRDGLPGSPSGNQSGNRARNLSEDLARDLAGYEHGEIAGDLPGGAPGETPRELPGDLSGKLATDLPRLLQSRSLRWPLTDYLAALQQLPEPLRADLQGAWGAPEDDPVVRNGAFHFAAVPLGRALVALQPERGTPRSRDEDYHDLQRVPRHAYVAFYLWLQGRADALVHIGAHGTLEWLPGKSVALSDACWPEALTGALTGALPVIYPFIVNDPGEAAQAKRRIGAVTLGHIPPPLKTSGTPLRLARLEALLDEFSTADGLDPRRRDRLQEDIRLEARSLGVEDDLGLEAAGCSAEAITRIDRFVCDVKESQFGEGLHVWGRPARPGAPFDTAASVAAERAALLAALEGRWIAPGPSGSPYRGRGDVLPTGRNIYTTDPRAVPTRAAHAQGVRLAEELVRRHLQDAGDWPRGLVVDLWGSATMRTAGEEFAMALHLLGCRPIWDAGSERVRGIEVLPIAELDRPRIDVTLRVSGLFRDVFPTLSALFASAVRALSARDEAADFNPYAGRAGARVFGPAPGSYGLGLTAALEDYSDAGRQRAGQAWLAASAWALDGEDAVRDEVGLRARLAGADAFVHPQDLPETDLLLAADYAAHEAGFAAAQALTGGNARLYHLDTTDPARPRARALGEEIARVVQARAGSRGWIDGMRAHGFRGAAEIAATLDHMAAFAHLAGVVGPHLFDLYFDATLGDEEVAEFMAEANPAALEALRARFRALLEAGLWVSRRNTVRATLEQDR